MAKKNNIISNPKTQLIIVLLIFLIGKILISGIGYLGDSDEGVFLYIYRNFEVLKSGDILSWYNSMEQQTGPLIESFIRFLQTFFSKSILNIVKPDYTIYDVAIFLGYINVIVSLSILVVFYFILKNLNFENSISILGVIILGVFTNYNIYLRHILPYENGLLINLISLMFLTSKNLDYKKILISGIFSAIALNTYYGYFMFFIINTSIIVYLFHSNFKEFKNIFFLFYTPLIIIILSLELIMQTADRSYISFIFSSSTTINQGSYNEGISYVAIYFLFVEKWYGIIILLLVLAGLYKLFSNKIFNKASFIALMGISAYLIYGFYVYFFQSMVFYGRILHMFYPFFILTSLIFIQSVKNRTRKVIIFSLIVLASFNYYQVIKDLNSIAYPINIAIDYKLNSNNITYSSVTELECLYDIHDINSIKLYNDNNFANISTDKYVLLNFGFFYHYPDAFINKFQKFKVKPNLKLIFSKTHFMSHPAYTFEYCTQKGRKFFIDNSLKIMILEIRN